MVTAIVVFVVFVVMTVFASELVRSRCRYMLRNPIVPAGRSRARSRPLLD